MQLAIERSQSIDIARLLVGLCVNGEESLRRRSSSHSVEADSVSLDRAQAPQASTKTSWRAKLHGEKKRGGSSGQPVGFSLSLSLSRGSAPSLTWSTFDVQSRSTLLRNCCVEILLCIFVLPVPRGRRSSESICSFNSERNALRSRNQKRPLLRRGATTESVGKLKEKVYVE